MAAPERLPHIVIDAVRPRTPSGRHPAKAVIGEVVSVGADVFKDGQELLAARVRWRPVGERKWRDAPLHLVERGLDRWAGAIEPADIGMHELVVEAWTDRLATWRHDVSVKREAGQAVDVELEEGARLLASRAASLPDGSRAEQSALRAAARRLADRGLDVEEVAAGLDERVMAALDGVPDDPGSPWAIGSSAGGHTSVAPELGTIEDLEAFVARAGELGMEVALDYALQCSPDHPWVGQHPEWFHHRPDGAIKFAENLPKRYEDIHPLNFWPPETGARGALWHACRDILDFWIGHGVRIFRVDNAHTKPMAFWEWLIPAVRAEHPEVIFLAEAFTRPQVMAKLAEVGFQPELHLLHVAHGEGGAHGVLARAHLRAQSRLHAPQPLDEHARHPQRPAARRGPAAFKARLVLAALLVPSYGIYSGYELMENQAASETNEEYLHSEKYELKRRDWRRKGSLDPFVTRLNAIRRRHPCFAELRNLRFHHAADDRLLVWSKHTADRTERVSPRSRLLYVRCPLRAPWRQKVGRSATS